VKYTFDDLAYPMLFEAAWGFPPSNGNVVWYRRLSNANTKQYLWLDLCRQAGYITPDEELNHEPERLRNACEDEDP
jgi:hypothetical protein